MRNTIRRLRPSGTFDSWYGVGCCSGQKAWYRTTQNPRMHPFNLFYYTLLPQLNYCCCISSRLLHVLSLQGHASFPTPSFPWHHWKYCFWPLVVNTFFRTFNSLSPCCQRKLHFSTSQHLQHVTLRRRCKSYSLQQDSQRGGSERSEIFVQRVIKMSIAQTISVACIVIRNWRCRLHPYQGDPPSASHRNGTLF